MSSYGTRPSTAVSTAASNASAASSSASNASAPIPAHVRLPLPGIPRRVSYTIPTPGSTASVPPHRPLSVFALPPALAAGEHRQCSTPLLLPSSRSAASEIQLDHWDGEQRHPKHTLAVTSLALDITSRIKPASQSRSDARSIKPGGILYTGGRDGLICSWELGLPLRQAKPRPRKKRRKANFLRPHDDDLDEEDEDVDPDDGPSAGTHDEEVSRVIQSELDGHRPGLSPSSDSTGTDPDWEVDQTMLAQTAKKRRTQFRQCLQSHTDWVNDILLCNHNQTLVSASSDRTVKIWNPHDPSTALVPTTIGSHADYVRCLAHASDANTVISGGLDRTVKIWDLEHTSRSKQRGAHGSDRPIWELPEHKIGHSVYALATTPSASMIAVGTPARSLRLWDPRAAPTASPIANLIGHTDNIRSLLLSADGRHLLSGSSDSTIRLWSVAEQRCLHTFTHHNDSVWSLFSSDDNLDVFYSGDRQGHLCKVDLEGCGDISEGECVLLARNTEEESSAALGAGGIQKILALDNTFIWTATGSSSVRLWRDVPSRAERERAYPISDAAASNPGARTANFAEGVPLSATEAFRRKHDESPTTSPRSTNLSLPGGSPTSPKGMDLDRPGTARPYARSRHPSEQPDWQETDVAAAMTLYGVPFSSLVSLAPANDPYGAAVGLGSTSVRDLPGALGRASLSFINASRSSFAFMNRGSTANVDGPGSHGHSLSLVPSRTRSIIDGPPPTSPPGNPNPGPSTPTPAANGVHVSFSAPDPLKKDRSASVLRFAPRVDINEPSQFDMPEHAIEDDEADDSQPVPDPALEARLAYEDRELAEDAMPFRAGPWETVEGAHGLIRCTMFNDRRHVLTVDARGQLAVWDILAAQMLGVIDPDEVRASASADEACQAAMAEKNNAAQGEALKQIVPQLIPAEVLEHVKTRLEGEGCCSPWCAVDVKTGALTVHVEEPRCFDAEIYLDECTDLIPAGIPRDDRRINVGKWILRNLLHKFIEAEAQLRVQEQATLLTGVPAFEHEALFQRRPSRGRSGGWIDQEHHVYTPGVTIPLAAAAKSPIVARPLRLDTVTQASVNRTPAAADASASAPNGTPTDYFNIAKPFSSDARVQTPGELLADDPVASSSSTSRWAGLTLGIGKGTIGPSPVAPSRAGTLLNDAVPPSPSTPTGGFMGRLRVRRGNKGTKDKEIKTTDAEQSEAATASHGSDASTSQSARAPHIVSLRQLLERPVNVTSEEDFPLLPYDPEMSVLISEAVPESGSWDAVYRGVVGCTGCDVSTLELTSPIWLLEFALASRTLARDQAAGKLSFTLHPWTAAQADSGGKWQPGQNALPALPAGNVRLSATRMLRMRKVSMYVCEKLDLLPARKHADSIAGSVKSNNDGTKTPQGLSMAAVTSRKGSVATMTGAPLTSSSSMHGADDAIAAEQQEQERARTRLAKSIEILHNGVLLGPEITLAQAQRFYQRSGGDIKLEYRQRPEADLVDTSAES